MTEKLVHRLEDRQQVFVFVLVGILCIIIPDVLIDYVPYIVGILFIIDAAVNLYAYYFKKAKVAVGKSIILLILSVVLMIQQENSITVLSIMWALLTLEECAQGIDEFIQNKSFNLFRGGWMIISILLSVALMYDPNHHLTFHMIVLGFEMIANAFIKTHHLYKIGKYEI